MARRKSATVDCLDHPADEPLVLFGEPSQLEGELRLRNPTGEKLILRDVRVHSDLLAGPHDKDTTGQQTLRRVILRPGLAKQVPLQLQVSPHTPPGEYRGAVEANGQRRELILHVTESLSLVLSPWQLVVENLPGERISKQVVFSNLGNVPVSIGQAWQVVLDEENLNCLTGRAAVAAVGDKVENMDQYMAELLHQTKKALERTGILRVRNTDGAFTLMPGEVRAVTLEIRVPEGLNKRSRYTGFVALYTSDLSFVVVPAPFRPKPRDERQPGGSDADAARSRDEEAK
jgi:hypothetical protein